MGAGVESELTRLEWSVRGLAQTADEQLKLFPSFVCVADELALEFDEHWRRVQSAEYGLSTFQKQVLGGLDSLLEEMSGPSHQELWTDEALHSAPEWTGIRKAAREVLEVFGWSLSAPPRKRGDFYVGADS